MFIVIAGITIIYLVIPLAVKTASKFMLMLDRRHTIPEAAYYEDQYKKAVDENNLIKTRLAAIKVNVSEDQRLSGIHTLLNGAASISGIRIVSMNVVSEGEKHTEISLEMSLSGRFTNMGKFIGTIENSEYVISIDELVLNTTDNHQISGKVKMTIHFANNS